VTHRLVEISHPAELNRWRMTGSELDCALVLWQGPLSTRGFAVVALSHPIRICRTTSLTFMLPTGRGMTGPMMGTFLVRVGELFRTLFVTTRNRLFAGMENFVVVGLSSFWETLSTNLI
jgi:hypothetical protein